MPYTTVAAMIERLGERPYWLHDCSAGDCPEIGSFHPLGDYQHWYCHTHWLEWLEAHCTPQGSGATVTQPGASYQQSRLDSPERRAERMEETEPDVRAAVQLRLDY